MTPRPCGLRPTAAALVEAAVAAGSTAELSHYIAERVPAFRDSA